ncbi:hypothetical protein [Anaerovorax odorimutans]|uniref:hypothetical protein n=1 Tax=Anaerovorax odorimutans TaxID=109327 RepID=UPI0004089967|nr:hypothetical protein [Anaerovorax odorimutans]
MTTSKLKITVPCTSLENELQISIPCSSLGDALPQDVVSGKTFTNLNGIGNIGTFTPSLSLEDATKDATATATDILDGKTAYSNGIKINGTLQINPQTVVKSAIKTVDVSMFGEIHLNPDLGCICQSFRSYDEFDLWYGTGEEPACDYGSILEHYIHFNIVELSVNNMTIYNNYLYVSNDYYNAAFLTHDEYYVYLWLVGTVHSNINTRITSFTIEGLYI